MNNNYTSHTRKEYSSTHVVGVSTLSTNGVIVYPNPMNNEFTIQLEKEWEDATATLIDMSGRIVTQIKLIQSLTTINTTNLNTGIYMLQINDREKKMERKVVKQ